MIGGFPDNSQAEMVTKLIKYSESTSPVPGLAHWGKDF